MTLLLITAQYAQLEAFKLLLTKGADIHAKDKVIIIMCNYCWWVWLVHYHR